MKDARQFVHFDMGSFKPPPRISDLLSSAKLTKRHRLDGRTKQARRFWKWHTEQSKRLYEGAEQIEDIDSR